MGAVGNFAHIRSRLLPPASGAVLSVAPGVAATSIRAQVLDRRVLPNEQQRAGCRRYATDEELAAAGYAPRTTLPSTQM
jgi:hypothetical protein